MIYIFKEYKGFFILVVFQFVYKSLSIFKIPPVVVLNITRVLTFLLNKSSTKTSLFPNPETETSPLNIFLPRKVTLTSAFPGIF